MRWQVLLISVVLFAFGIGYGAPAPQQGVIFYASPEGNNAWSGKLAAANENRTDGPFATIEKARDAIRDLRAQGPLTQPVTVYIRGGLYVLPEPLVFSPEDSGTQPCPITYAAYPGETPVLSGGRKIPGWKKLTETGEVSGIDAKARGKLWVADVPKGWRFNQLFVDGKRLPRSVMPNADQWESWYKATEGKGKAILYFPPGTIRRWPNLEDVEINLVPFLGSRFTNFLAPVKELSEEARVVTLTGGGPYDIKKD